MAGVREHFHGYAACSACCAVAACCGCGCCERSASCQLPALTTWGYNVLRQRAEGGTQQHASPLHGEHAMQSGDSTKGCTGAAPEVRSAIPASSWLEHCCGCPASHSQRLVDNQILMVVAQVKGHFCPDWPRVCSSGLVSLAIRLTRLGPAWPLPARADCRAGLGAAGRFRQLWNHKPVVHHHDRSLQHGKPALSVLGIGRSLELGASDQGL